MLRRYAAPILLTAILLLALHAVAAAQGCVLVGPVDNAVATRGVTAWWADTYPKALKAHLPCTRRAGDPHDSALLTCFGAMGRAGAKASCVATWQWACPQQRAVRCRCPVMSCLCRKPCKIPCSIDPCACSMTCARQSKPYICGARTCAPCVCSTCAPCKCKPCKPAPCCRCR